MHRAKYFNEGLFQSVSTCLHTDTDSLLGYTRATASAGYSENGFVTFGDYFGLDTVEGVKPALRVCNTKRNTFCLPTTVTGYSCGAWIYGLWNSRIIYNTSKAKINLPYMDRITKYAENITDIAVFDGYAYLRNYDDDTAYLFNEQSKKLTQLSENFEIYAITEDCAIVQETDEKSGTASYEKMTFAQMGKNEQKQSN